MSAIIQVSNENLYFNSNCTITIKFYYFYYYLLLFIIHNFSIFFNIQKIILKQKNTKKKLSIL